MVRMLEYNATLSERIDLTDKLAIFRVCPDPGWAGEGMIPDFEGGQYIALGMNNDAETEKGGVMRPYSIASPPEEKRHLEFYIRYADHPVSDNPLTHLLWRLPVGGRLHLGRKITGHFTLGATVGDDDPRLKIFVAAGTGLAPFVSILLSRLRQGRPVGEFAVLHGARDPQDLGYRDDLRRVFADLPERYAPSISSPAWRDQWDGHLGRVETFFDDESLSDLEARLGLAEGELVPTRCVVYICGFYGTIHSTLVRLLRRGFVPNDRQIRKGLGLIDEPASLFFEQYDNEPILDTRNHEAMARLLAETPFAGKLKSEP